MTDLITITDLELWIRIGVPAMERATEQRLLVSIELSVDTRMAAKNDAVTIDYDLVTKDVRRLCATEVKTIERFAEDIAAMILSVYKPRHVKITVKKFVIPGSKFVSLTIERP